MRACSGVFARSAVVHHAPRIPAQTAGRMTITRGAAPHVDACHLPLAGAVAGADAHEARGALPGRHLAAALHRVKHAGSRILCAHISGDFDGVILQWGLLPGRLSEAHSPLC